MNETWRRDIPQWHNMGDIAWGPTKGPRIAHGHDARLVSRSSDTDGSATLVQRVPANWTYSQPADGGTLEMMILSGGLTIDGEPLGAGGFVAVPPTCGTVEFASAEGAEFLVFWNPELDTKACYPDGALQRRDTWSEPWVAIDVPDMHGVFFKDLRVPSATVPGRFGGPGGSLMLLYSLPGIGTEGREHHDDTWEEILCLSGDIYFTERGLGVGGTVISNPAYYEHGPYTTQRGHFGIAQTVRPLPMTFTPRPGGPQLMRNYQRTASLLEPTLRTEGWTETDAALLAKFAQAESD